MDEHSDLTISAAAIQMRQGELTAQALIESCLERIHTRENIIHAWVEVYEKTALEEARRCDQEARMGKWRGDLHGIPLGVKDIIDVKGMWTRAGTSIYPARVAEVDAPSVHRAKAAGAIILGKTETTPFANNDPTITRNPWNPAHTPGGSSSGSAAAVADRTCLAALGTQTGGSLLRPAAYTSIVGFKPTYGYISAEGVMPNSWSLDTVGVYVRCVADVEILRTMLLLQTRRVNLCEKPQFFGLNLNGGWFEYMILTGGIGCDLVVDHGQAEAIVLGARMFRKRGRFVVGAAYASSTASKIDFGAICNQNELTFIGRTMLGHDCRNK